MAEESRGVDEFTIHPGGTEPPEHFDLRLAKVVAEAGGRWVSFECSFDPMGFTKRLRREGYDARARGSTVWVRPKDAERTFLRAVDEVG